MGSISISDLRFGNNYTDSENFSSILGVLLYSLLWLYPLFLIFFYLKTFKPLRQSIKTIIEDETNFDVRTNKFQNRYKSVEGYIKNFQSKFEREKYLEKYGSLFSELKLDSIGINKAIAVVGMNLFDQLVVVVAVMYF